MSQYQEEDWKRLLEEGEREARLVDAKPARNERGGRIGNYADQGHHGYEPDAKTPLSASRDSRDRNVLLASTEDQQRDSGDDKASANGSVTSRPYSSRRGSYRPDSYRHDDRRGGVRDDRRHRLSYSRSRSRSPYGRDRDYGRPRYRDDYRRDDYRDRDRRRDRDRYEPAGRRSEDRGDRRGDRYDSRGGRNSAQPPADTGKDEATVFVQQLSRQAREKHLAKFFEQVGAVRSAKVVTDRDGRHSKGVGFVEFADVASVERAINLTGQKLMGVPIIVQKSEAEKNRVAPAAARGQPTLSNGIPFNRLYIGNVHFNISESDIADLFGAFGTVAAVQMSLDDSGRSRGHGFVQFEKADDAKEALGKMNGQDLIGRPLRVGLGSKEMHAETAASGMQRLNQAAQDTQGSSFSGAGGRGGHNAGGREDKNAGSMGALDDSDLTGVNYSNFSREALMKKLARTEDLSAPSSKTQPKKTVASFDPARCILIKNAYNEANEDEGWEKELADDFKDECSAKYGKVVHCAIPDNDRDEGQVYVKFEDLKGGDSALKGLNGRLFGGKVLTAQPVIDAIYNSMFPKAAGL